MAKPENSKSQYQHVIGILDAADLGSTSDYGGVGKFWRLPLDEFKTTKVCGVQMIAPASSSGQSAGHAAFMENLAQRRRPNDTHQNSSADTQKSCCSSEKEEEPARQPETSPRDKPQNAKAYKKFKRYIARKLKVLNGYSYQVFCQTAT